MPLNPNSAPFVPGPPRPNPTPPPLTVSPFRGPLDYESPELAQGDQIWGLSALPPSPPPPSSPPSTANPSLEDDSAPLQENIGVEAGDQTYGTAKEELEVDEEPVEGEGSSSELVERAQDQEEKEVEVEVEEAPSSPPPQLQDDEPEEEDDDEPFLYPTSSSTPPPPELAQDSPSSSSDPLQSSSPSDPLRSLPPPPTSNTSPKPVLAPTPPSATSPAPLSASKTRSASPPPDPTLVPSIIAAIASGELFKLERIFAASSLSPFALSNTPLSQHTLLTPLHLAASHGHLPIVQWLCSSEGGALVGMEDAEGETALHKASLKGHLSVISFLIKNQGVNPHARDKEGFTALHNACSKGFLDIVRFLCSNSSAASYDPEESLSSGEGRVKGVDRRSKGGWTPLMCACADGHLPVVLYLITKQNADPLVRNNFGETAYDVSAGVFEVYICEVLEQFEASRWPSGDAPRAEPYNVLAVHTSVPVVVYENQRLDARLKTLALSSGKPRFSPSGLGKLGRRSPWELKVPTGSRVHAGTGVDEEEEGKWAGVIPCRKRKEEVGLPERRRGFVMPLPKGEEETSAGEEEEEKSHFWLSDWAVDVSSPKVDAQTGWSYAPSFSTPYELWLPSPPPPLSHLLSGASSLVSAALVGSAAPRSVSSSDHHHHLSATPSTRAEQGSATWVRRRGWVRIMRRRLDLDPLPFLEPDGMTIAGFEADGGRVGGSGRRRTGGDHDDEEGEGEEMGSFPASWVSGASTVDAGGGNGGVEGGEGDYLARARYLTGGRKGLKGVGGDAVSVRTVRGRQGSLEEGREEGEREREATLPDLRRRLGKLERAVGGLRRGLMTETNDFRKNAAGTLLVELSNELEGLRTTIASRAGTGVNADSSEYDSNSDSSEFTYPTSPAAPSSSSARSRRPRGSNASRTTSASTDYFHVAGSQIPDITTVLSESEAFRVPTHEAGLKVRRTTGGLLSPMIARAEWERDELATDCRRCRRRFTFFLRKHHCRRCGLVVCDACSPHRVVLPPSDIVLDPNTPFSRLQDEIHIEHRTCDPCFAEVTTPALGRSLASVSESSGSREGGSSVASDLAECPVCNRTLAELGGNLEQEAHVRACLEDGGSSVQAGRYLVYHLKPESSLVGVECVICLEEFLPGSKVARLNCLCSFHDHCLSAWLSRGRSCPVHARET